MPPIAGSSLGGATEAFAAPGRKPTPAQGRDVNWDDVIVEAAATDTGMRRSNNQDSYTIVRATSEDRWRSRGHLFMVADGMGAHAVGELASKLACDNIPHHYTKSKTAEPVEALSKAYRDVGALIYGKSSANKDFEGMGTTATTMVLLPAGALIAHVGDSRVYRIRQGRIDQLSFDHSLAWELVRLKHLTPDQARIAPRNVITRSLGPEPTVEVDIEGPLPVELGDVYLLCSDGLSGPVNDPELGAFAAHFHPNDACQYLMHLANLRGGSDNITVVMARIGAWVEPGTEAAPTAETPAKNHRSGKGFLSGLLGSLKSKPAAEPVEEHIYKTAECPISAELLDKLQEDIRAGKDNGIENTWPVDWPKLALRLRNSDAKRALGDFRGALHDLGEAITMLGIGGRVHRKQRIAESTH